MPIHNRMSAKIKKKIPRINKCFSAVHIIIGIASIITFLIYSSTFAKQAPPPIEMESNRSQPVGAQLTSDSVRGHSVIFIHHPYLFNRPVIKLVIPDRYFRTGKSGAINLTGFAFFSDYPNLQGVFDYPNNTLASCSGFCNGRMLIEIHNEYGDNFSLKTFEKAERNNHVYSNIRAIDSDGFSRAEEVEWKNYLPKIKQNRYYLIDRLDANIINRYVQCLISVPNPTCEEWFLLKSYPGVMVHYTFSYKLMRQSFDVRYAVEKLVNSFVAEVR